MKLTKYVLPLILLLLCSSVYAQPGPGPGPQTQKGSLAGPVLVANLPTAHNSNILYDVRDALTSTDCTVGGGTTRVVCKWNGSAYAPLPSVASGSTVGNVTGAASSTDNAVARMDGTGGKTIQNSGVIIDDSNNLSGATVNGIANYAVDSVGTDSYAITPSPSVAALVDGLQVRFKAGTSNTGGATLAVSGLTAKALVKSVGGLSTALATGDILAGDIVTAIYSSVADNFQVKSLLGTAPQPLDSDLTIIAGLTPTTDNFIQSKSSAWASRTIAQVITDLALPYDVAASYDSTPSASSTIRIVVPRAFNSGTNFAGTICSAGTAATAQTDFLIKNNGSTVATLRFAAAGTTCTIVSPTTTAFAIADVITIVAPGTPDGTLANIAVSIKGTLP